MEKTNKTLKELRNLVDFEFTKGQLQDLLNKITDFQPDEPRARVNIHFMNSFHYALNLLLLKFSNHWCIQNIISSSKSRNSDVVLTPHRLVCNLVGFELFWNLWFFSDFVRFGSKSLILGWIGTAFRYLSLFSNFKWSAKHRLFYWTSALDQSF